MNGITLGEPHAEQVCLVLFVGTVRPFDRADLAWETVEAVLSSEEEEPEERAEGTLGF